MIGSFLLSGASINVGPEVVEPNTIEVVGPNNTLLENASAATTLWVQGNDCYNAGVLTAAPDAFNAGTIILASVGNSWGETLAAPDGMVNQTGGHIAVYGGGGPAILSGDLTNDGDLSLSGVSNLYIDTLVNNATVSVDASGQFLLPGATALTDAGAAESVADQTGGPAAPPALGDAPLELTQVTVGAWTNNGIVAVDPGTQLDVASDGSGRDTFTQAGGFVAVDGRMIIDGGLFHLTGGTVWGAFIIRNGQIQVDGSATQPADLSVVGNSTLLDNSGAATLLVDGGSPVGYGDVALTAAPGATNSGTIVLQSLDGVHNGYLSVPTGLFTNTASGLIQVNVVPGQSGQGMVLTGGLYNGAALTDSTGLPTTQSNASLLALLEQYLQDGIPVDPGLADASEDGRQTPGVGDGVIGTLPLVANVSAMHCWTCPRCKVGVQRPVGQPGRRDDPVVGGSLVVGNEPIGAGGDGAGGRRRHGQFNGRPDQFALPSPRRPGCPRRRTGRPGAVLRAQKPWGAF